MKKLTYEEMKSVTGGCHVNLLGCEDDPGSPDGLTCCAVLSCMGYGGKVCNGLEWYLGL